MFPLNLVVGAAVGAAVTYVYKDEPAKQWLRESGSKLKEGASSFVTSFKKKPAAQVETSAEAVSAEETKEAPAEKS